MVLVLVQTSAPEWPPAGVGPVFWKPAGSLHWLHRRQPEPGEGPRREPHSRHPDGRVRNRVSGSLSHQLSPAACDDNVPLLLQECVSTPAGGAALRFICRLVLATRPEGRDQRGDGASDRLHRQGVHAHTHTLTHTLTRTLSHVVMVTVAPPGLQAPGGEVWSSL